MEIKNSINILGTDYKINVVVYDDERLTSHEASGICDSLRKVITISDMGDFPAESADLAQKKILRHEIIHAFLAECGLDENSLVLDDAWAVNEEMVEWISVMIGKIMRSFRELGIEGDV